MFYEHPPALMTRIFSNMIWNIPENDMQVHLTFDDGPTPGVTEEVLQILNQYNAKATFFCLGKNVDKHPFLSNKIQEEGHALGNHTYSHLNGWKTSKHEYINDINLASKYIKSNYFRPPYGKIRKNQLSQVQKYYQIVLWDVISGDFKRNLSPARCLNNVLTYTKPGSIIVFHDSLKASKNLLYTLPRFLETYSEKQYHFNKIH